MAASHRSPTRSSTSSSTSAARTTSSPAGSARFNRARVPAPFPVHRWDDYIPDVVVLPTERRADLGGRQAREPRRVPVVPRAGGTGLTDGAVPLRHGILVDVKLMNQIHEIDLDDRTVTVGPGINMLKLYEELRPLGYIYPDNPASYPCSLVGGRIGTSGWSLIGGALRAHPRPRHLASRSSCRPARSSASATAAARRSASRPRATSSSTCSWGTRGRSASSPRRRSSSFPGPRPSSPPSSRYRSYEDGWRATGDSRAFRARHPRRRRPLRRVEARLPAPRRRGVHPAARLGEGRRRRAPCTARRTRCARAPSSMLRIAQENGCALPRRRDLPGRLGLAPRPLCDAAARPHERTARSRP